MDYEKKYKKVFKKAKKELQTCGSTDCDAARQIYRFFPELQESEDERIRKDIIVLVKDWWDRVNKDNISTKEQMIAWLEKQGQEKHLSEPIKDYQGSFTCWNNAHDFRPKHLQRCICYDKYMGGVYCYVYDDISKYWCTQTTEEHDSDGDNHISDYADYRITLWMPLPDTSFCPSKSLLEKQGENPQGKTSLEAAKEEKVDNANKTEPKFHEGDWVVDKQGIVHQIANVVENVTNHTYGYDVVGDGYFNDNTEGVRLWTINDAKNGDVLASGHLVFIFKVIHGVWLNCHCSAHNDGSFIADSYDLMTNKYFSEVHPATKEQRDTLTKAMANAGWEFDLDKKELRKIEQNLASSAKNCKEKTSRQ